LYSLGSPYQLEDHYLTKGDNNDDDDTIFYPPGQRYLKRSDIVGSVRGYLPGAGYITIVLHDYPWLKKAALGLIGLLAMLQKG
jgi:signal peptidase I